MMIALLWLVTAILTPGLKSKCRLEAENAVLRHQVMKTLAFRDPFGYALLSGAAKYSPLF
jgi:hypothetical protein